jgi:energy-coupling factor transporter ATP-binding protein EcfA2
MDILFNNIMHSNTSIFEDLSQNEFKLPIQYNDHKTLNETILNDLDLNTNNNVYNYLLKNDEDFNYLLDDHMKYYSTSKQFLKETQKFCANINPSDFNLHDIKDVTTGMEQKYASFISETSFDDKYQYLSFNILKPFNRNPLFLQCLSYYNLSTPVLSLATPIFILIVPFFVLKFRGFSVSLTTYISILKEMLSRTMVFRNLMNFNDGNINQKVSIIVSLIFYVIQIYHNIKSCITFYRNMTDIDDFISAFKNYVKFSLSTINKLRPYIDDLETYKLFLQDIESHEVVLKNILLKMEHVIPINKHISKVTQMGILLKLNYELFYDTKIYNSFIYTVNLHQYINDIVKIGQRIKERKINKRLFKDSKIISGMYYLPFIDSHSYVSNDIDLKTNILITGPNASGKTTLIKSLFLNVILSQQWGYGCFKSCKMQIYNNFYSYLNIPDTSNRDSLFQAEARRCKDIIESIHETKERNLCIFDEIYSGTNPTDAILCATAYLKALTLYKSHCDFVITTHYIDMCKSFESSKLIKNMKMNTTEKGKTINYSYKIEDGISMINGGKQVLYDLEYPSYVLDFV